MVPCHLLSWGKPNWKDPEYCIISTKCSVMCHSWKKDCLKIAINWKRIFWPSQRVKFPKLWTLGWNGTVEIVLFPSEYGALCGKVLGVFWKFCTSCTIMSGALPFRNPPLSHSVMSHCLFHACTWGMHLILFTLFHCLGVLFPYWLWLCTSLRKDPWLLVLIPDHHPDIMGLRGPGDLLTIWTSQVANWKFCTKLWQSSIFWMIFRAESWIWTAKLAKS